VTSHLPTVRCGSVCTSNPWWCCTPFHAIVAVLSAHQLNMASGDESIVAALIYDYLLKKDTSLAQIFQKKTKAVSIRSIVYYALIFEVTS
jgi:hypothetical protein